ncbi:hypothetical protein ACLB2K_019438 [Fragaria x ananassa]
MHNSVQNLRIIKSFGAECRLGRAPRVIEVVWHPPVIGWVKINSDGAWKHAEGVDGFGAVFRDFKGHVLGAFSSNIDIPSSVAAEVMTVIVAIELAWAPLMKMRIGARGKVGYLIGAKVAPDENSPEFETRATENERVKSWLIDSMEPSLINRYIRLPTANDVWDAIEKIFYDDFDETRIFELNKKCFAAR